MKNIKTNNQQPKNTTTAITKAKYQIMLEEEIYLTAVYGAPEKVRPVVMVGHNTYSQYSVDHTKQYCAYLKKLGVSYSIGNDAPRGGKLGKFIAIDTCKAVYNIAINQWASMASKVKYRDHVVSLAVMLHMEFIKKELNECNVRKFLNEQKSNDDFSPAFSCLNENQRELAIQGAMLLGFMHRKGYLND